MKVTVICVGKIKEKYLRDGVLEYSKRLSRYVCLNIIEVDDEKAPDNLSEADARIIKEKEGARILKHVKDGFVVALALCGKQKTSEELSDFFKDNMNRGVSHIIFIIGGSLGLSSDVLSRSDLALSFSQLTFPHQLMRVILLEQIYRGFKILKGEPYHK